MHDGIIYCFNTISDPLVLKCGFTQQTLSARLKGYLGPSKPRTVIFQRRVQFASHAEQIMLMLMRQCRCLTSRTDLGHEWFSIEAGAAFDELINIANVTQLASRELPTSKTAWLVPEHAVRLEAQGEMKLAFRTYFSKMDAFVRHDAPTQAFSSADVLMESFDTSVSCPVFSEYLPYGRDARLGLVASRYRAQLAKSN